MTVRAGDPVPEAIREAASVLADDHGVLERPLVYVTGKGGVGKTTVAGGLALVAAERGRRVLVCGQGRLPAGVHAVRLDADTALAEWLARHLGAPASALLRHSPVFRYFVAAAPGAAELVTIGKAFDVARSGEYDCVIFDGPATGHALAMLGAPRTFSRLGAIGPVTREAAELARRLADPAFAAYVGVTAPEPMAVEELFMLARSLPSTVGRGLDLVVVNAVHPDRFSDEEARRLREAAERGPGRALLEAVLAGHRRARREAEQVRRVRAQLDVPVVTVPFAFGAGPARGAAPAAAEHAVALAGAARTEPAPLAGNAAARVSGVPELR